MKKIILAVAIASISAGAMASEKSSELQDTSFNIGYAQINVPVLKDAGFNGNLKGITINVKSQLNDYFAFRSTFDYVRTEEDAYHYYSGRYYTDKLKVSTVRGGGALLLGTTIQDEKIAFRPYVLVGAGYQSNSGEVFGYSGSGGSIYGQIGAGIELELEHLVTNLSISKDTYEEWDSTTTVEATIGYKF